VRLVTGYFWFLNTKGRQTTKKARDEFASTGIHRGRSLRFSTLLAGLFRRLFQRLSKVEVNAPASDNNNTCRYAWKSPYVHSFVKSLTVVIKIVNKPQVFLSLF